MFFSLCNSPSTFQNMMDHIFADMIEEGWLSIFMDDMIIANTKGDNELHGEHTLRVLIRAAENDLYLKPDKCEFAQKEIEYLGYIIKEGYIGMDPKKLKGVLDWPTPTTVKQV